jgi:hypothetical protein
MGVRIGMVVGMDRPYRRMLQEDEQISLRNAERH